MLAPAVFAFGLVAFGFLGMGPVTIAVDSYGPVTDNAQSVFELSVIERYSGHPAGAEEGLRDQRTVRARRKRLLEENDGAGNTFKATAKPVLIGTAVVGATTMIFSIIVELTEELTGTSTSSSLLHAAVPARAGHRWRDHLLVHRRVDAGGDDRCLSRRRVHQGEHQARGRGEGIGRGQQEGRRDLHAVTRRRGCSTSS